MEYVRGLEKATHKTCHVHGLPTQLMGSQAESRLAVSVTMDILMLRCEPWKNLKVQIKKKIHRAKNNVGKRSYNLEDTRFTVKTTEFKTVLLGTRVDLCTRDHKKSTQGNHLLLSLDHLTEGASVGSVHSR